MPVLSNSDLVQSLETGVIPVPPEVQADNDARDGKKQESAKPAPQTLKDGQLQASTTALADAEDAGDVEGDDGLTPNQKRDLTKKMQLSIGKKHRQMREAEEFAAEQYNEKRLAEQNVERLQREIARLKEASASQGLSTVDPEARPAREQFQSDGDYEKAVIDWRVNEVLKERDASEAKRKATEEAEHNAQRLRSRLDEVRTLVPDFEEVAEGAKDINIPPHIAAALAESDLFAELGYYLAKHSDEAKKIMAMTPTRGLVALGRIEAILKPFEKSKVSNGSSKPSQDAGNPASVETGNLPSKPRAAAPIEPLTTPSEPQSDAPVNVRNVRQEIDRWQKTRSGDLLRRRRH